MKVLRCVPKVTITKGAPRQISDFAKQYVTQRGLVCTWTGLGFNLCVAPTLTFCPCILDGWMNWGLEGGRGEGETSTWCDMFCVIGLYFWFQTEELEYMMQAYIQGDGNGTGAWTRGRGLGIGGNYGEMRQEYKKKWTYKWIARFGGNCWGLKGDLVL